MRGSQHLLQWLVFVFALACIQTFAQYDVNVTRSSVVINAPDGGIQVYPSGKGVQPTDACPAASWKKWKLHTFSPNYDPLHWSKGEWRDYIVNYPLRSAGLSIAFLLVGIGAFLIAITWRLTQWCVSCGRCQRACGLGSQDTAFLGDTKHRYLKAWIYLLIAGALGMVVWGMLAMDRQVIATFWEAFTDGMDYGRDVNKGLQDLKDGITQTLPAKLRTTADVVNGTVAAGQLAALVEAGVKFNNASQSATASLLKRTISLDKGLTDGVLAGLVTLTAQLGNPVVPGAAATLATSYDSLYGLLPALRSSLPVVAAANATRAAIQERLQTLSDALAGVQSALSPSPTSPEVATLRSALGAIRLTAWDQQLGQVVTGLQVYNASRSGPAFANAKDAADRVLEGAVAASPSAVSELQGGAVNASSQMTGQQAYGSLKSLRQRLLNISSNVTKVNDWDVKLGNGTAVGILDMTSFLLGAMADFVTADASVGISVIADGLSLNSGGGNSSSGDAVNVTTFLQVAQRASGQVSQLAPDVNILSVTAASARSIATGGPDPAPAATQIDGTLRPALSGLAGPVNVVSAALSSYVADPNAVNLAALRVAAAGAAGPVGGAAATFAPPLANAAPLESTCQSLGLAADSLQRVGADVSRNASALYGTLAAAAKEVGGYMEGLGELVAVLRQLPNGTDARAAVSDIAYDIQDRVADVVGLVNQRVDGAAAGLRTALADLQDKLLGPGSRFAENQRGLTEDISRIGYPVAMAAWGFGALFLLGLALSVFRNWPAGLVGFGLALLFYITLSQVVASGVSFAMGALGDGCGNLEQLAMREIVEHSSSPKVSVALSFYLYKVPATPEIMLQAAFGLNASDVRARLASVNETISRHIDGRHALQGTTAALVSALRDLSTSMRGLFESVITRIRYDVVHGLYANTKSVACCDAGNFAHHEWCAITAAAALSFGALVSTVYLLARLDMAVQRRRSCCSCCSCACYRPQRYLSDVEEAAAQGEDKFAKAAKKQHEDQLLQQRQHQQQSRHNDPRVKSALGGGGGRTRGGFDDVVVAGSAVGTASAAERQTHGSIAATGSPWSSGSDPSAASPLPSGFATAAGSAADAVAQQQQQQAKEGAPPPAAAAPSEDDCYAAPSAPPMTAGSDK